MASDAEVAIRTLNTKAFIDAEPASIVLTRHSYVSDGAGGQTRTTTMLASQQARIVTANQQLPLRQTVDGREVQPSWTLIGMPDLDVEAGDTFVYAQTRYEVLFVYPARLDATRADVGYGR